MSGVAYRLGETWRTQHDLTAIARLSDVKIGGGLLEFSCRQAINADVVRDPLFTKP